MAPQKTLTAVLLIGSAICAGCGTDQGTPTGDDQMGMGSDEVGTGGDTGGNPTDPTEPGAPTDPGVITTPVYPTSHPRIYLTPNRSRLTAALNSRTPAATRFKSIVDS